MVKQGIYYLQDLQWFLKTISQEFYTQKNPLFSFDSSIGSHCRHVIEFYTQFLNFYSTNEINYDDRQRDLSIETELKTAIVKLDNIQNILANTDFVFEKQLELVNNHALTTTTIGREINYLAEHNVHHLAIIRLMAEALNFSFADLPNFGIAHATQVARMAQN